jgi:hypothetical protein
VERQRSRDSIARSFWRKCVSGGKVTAVCDAERKGVGRRLFGIEIPVIWNQYVGLVTPNFRELEPDREVAEPS